LDGSICRGEAPFTTRYFAPGGRGAASTGAVRVETDFAARPDMGSLPQPHAAKAPALPTAFNFAVRIEQSPASKSA
jgi:hypothetical protein